MVVVSCLVLCVVLCGVLCVLCGTVKTRVSTQNVPGTHGGRFERTRGHALSGHTSGRGRVIVSSAYQHLPT